MKFILNAVLNNRKRQSDGVEIKIIDESIEELSSTDLQFALVVLEQGGSVVFGSTVQRTISDNGGNLAQSVRVISYDYDSFCFIRTLHYNINHYFVNYRGMLISKV